MPQDAIKQYIEETIQHHYAPQLLIVKNVSHHHKGHASATTQSHYTVHIEDRTLSHLSRIKAHRSILSLFQDIMPTPLHSLSIHIVAPAESLGYTGR